MKKALSIVLIFILVISLSSCTYRTELITDMDKYESICLTDDYVRSEKSILFPDIENRAFFIDFICRRKMEVFFNTDMSTEWQVKLEAKYDETTFNAELSRIKEVCKGSPIFGESEQFDIDAYATLAGRDTCVEYALIYPEENKIVYILLRAIDGFFVSSENGERAFSEEFFPKDYMEMINNNYFADFNAYLSYNP